MAPGPTAPTASTPASGHPGRRAFATVPYAPRGEGERMTLAPVVMPQSCVHAAPGDPTCELRVHHRRDRKTGPQVPVTVVQCQTHGRACTLYPLGHVPYGRLPVAPVAPDGQVLFSAEPEAGAASAQPPAWRITQFAAAFTAVETAPVKLTDPRWWATPAPARLTQSALLLGVHPTLAVADADALAFRLAIPGLVLRQARADYAAACGPAGRGQILVDLLRELAPAPCVLDRVLEAGAYAGCWGPVTRWSAAAWGAQGQVFPGRGAPAG